MVIAWIHLLLLLPAFLFSADFTARLCQNEIALNESFNLELTLKDASPTRAPAIDLLSQAFHIHSQRQSYSTMIMNGKSSSSNTWTLVLMPKELGTFTIPAISIETSAGKLSSQPIRVNVIEKKQSDHENDRGKIWLESNVSRSKPYKNEPFLLNIRLLSKQILANIRVEKFTIDGAIVEVAGEPEILERMENGIKTALVEFKYLVTPLACGVLYIPRIQVLGDIPEKNNTHSLFDDSFAAFSLMPGFVNLQPFGLETKEMQLEIRKPEALNPWLPASHLEIHETFNDSQTFREGEVYNRSFEISAEGIHSSQLPSLETFQDKSGNFKVYADKPQLKSEIVNGKLKSYRLEQYTLIPKKSGELTLPEITVNWWNTTKEEKASTTVSKRQIEVLPALNTKENTEVALLDERKSVENDEREMTSQLSPLIFMLIAGFVILILALIVALIILQRKINSMSNEHLKKKSNIQATEKLHLNKIVPAQTFPEKKKDKLKDLNPT